ncbi:MAG: serine hydrolase [Candidatus Saccharimonadales bacterium]
MLPRQIPVHTQKRPSRHIGRRLVVIVLLVAAMVGYLHIRPLSTVSAVSKRPTKVAQSPTTTSLAAMATNVNHILTTNSTVDISVTALDLKTGKTYNYGPSVVYEAASEGKLVAAICYTKQVEQGTYSWSTTLEDGSSAKSDMEKMIVNSDDTAWQSFIDLLTNDTLNSCAQDLGITDYDANANTLSSSDVALLLQKLYEHNATNNSDRALLLGYLKIANYREYIIPALPSDVTSYHKTGLLDDRIHDAAIIDNGSNPIVLVIMTNGHGTYDFTDRTTAIQQITKAVLAGFKIT